MFQVVNYVNGGITIMAIALEFLDFIVPISVIKEKYPGGWEQCLTDHEPSIGQCIWYDKYLFKSGAMNPMDIKSMLERWTELGFEPYEEIDGKRYWKDLCVSEVMFYGRTTLPCQWFEFDRKEKYGYLKGTEPGKISNRNNPRSF